MIPLSGGCRFGVLGGRVGRGDLAGAAHLELVSGVLQLPPQDAMFEAMLRGWHAQQVARGLREDTIVPRERLVRRFLEFTNEYPWTWGPSHVDEWTLGLVSERSLAPSTIRGYQMDLRLFSEYLCDGRYGWAAACEKEFGQGAHPVPVCHEWNTIAHLNGYEGNPEARPFTRQELQRFLDYADDQVDRAARARRKGALAAYRDATLFKVIYGWGLRRTEASRLDMTDWGRNPAAPEFGRFGTLHVRYGKAKRGQPPRRRNVASVMAWAVDAVADYAGNVRPRVRLRGSPCAVGDRAGRAGQARGDQRPVRGLPRGAGPAGCSNAAQPATFLCHASDRGRRGPEVHPGPGRPRARQLHGHLHARQRRLHEHGAAQGPCAGVRGSRPAEGAVTWHGGSTTGGTCGR
jgi:integrase/recombinase XerC